MLESATLTQSSGPSSTAPSGPFERESWVATLWRELARSLGGLLRSPRYTVPALLSVALGTGASLSVFAVFSALTLRPLPFREPEQLVNIGFPGASGWAGPEVLSVSPPLVAALKEHASIFESVTALRGMGARLEVDGMPALWPGTAWVPLNFFDTLGVTAVQGRTFSARETNAQGTAVVVLSQGLWRDALGSAPVLGKTVIVDGSPRTVIGIIADDQASPAWASLWYPVDIEQSSRPGEFFLNAIGRLAKGVTPALAQQRLSQLMANVDVRSPAGERLAVRVTSLREVLVRAERSWLRLMLAAVLSFLLLACANLAALLATRASVRQRERAVCAALGASRRLLTAQSLLEAFLLALAGSFAGLGLAQLGVGLANRQYAEALGNLPARIDGRLLVGLFVLILACTLAGSAWPVIATRRIRPMDSLSGAGRASEGRAATRLRDLLVAVQVAVTTVLLVNAGLLVRSLQATLRIDPGFQSTGVVTAAAVLRLPPQDGSEQSIMAQIADGRRQVEALLERVQSLPGVLHATVSNDLPFDYVSEMDTLELEPGAPQRSVAANIRNVGPGHFETLGIRLISGKLFGPEEQRGWPPQRYAIANQSLARQGLGVEDAVGHRVRWQRAPGSDDPDSWIQIIGMVENTRELSLTDPPPPALYFPFLAYPTRGQNQNNVRVAVALEVAGPPAEMLARLPASINEVLPGTPVIEVRMLSELIGDSFARSTALSQVLSSLALAAVALSVIGLFGITSYSVARRSSEIGIRRALGASRRAIRGMILRETGWVVGVGLATGLFGAWFGRHLLASFLFGVGALDPVTYVGVCVGVVVATVAAALAAARSATSIAPASALSGR